MARSKKTLARRRRARRRNPEGEAPRERASRVTAEATDLAYTVGAGVAGYAAVRLGSRGAVMLAQKKYPKLAKHASPVGAALGAASAWLASRYWDKFADYHDAVTVGAGVALAQSVITTYLPQFAWVVSDVGASPAAPSRQIASPSPSDADLQRLLDDNGLVEGPAVAQLPAVSPGAASAPGAMSADDLADYNGMGDGLFN